MSGQRRRVGGVTVVRLPGPTEGTRIGLVVGRSVGNAVSRNRAKRRLRHSLAALPLEQGMDYVIIADSAVVSAPFATLQGWLGRAVGSSR